MIARAPGKVVLAGAYAVLEGAPAWVAAVDRYVTADSARAPVRVTPEVREALCGRAETAPWFDASELRDRASDRKLGMGSSAAIVVASLAALELEQAPRLGDTELAARVFPRALAAHRAAQGGGSGIDVAASAYGGVLRFQRAGADDAPVIAARALPAGLRIAVWSSPQAASTSSMVARVTGLWRDGDRVCRAIVARLRAASEACDTAQSPDAWLAIYREQLAGLSALGEHAGIPIVTLAMRAFHDAARAHDAVVLPSGAGGGDVILLVTGGALDPDRDHALGAAGRELGLLPLDLALGARGVHAASSDPQRNHAP